MRITNEHNDKPMTSLSSYDSLSFGHFAGAGGGTADDEDDDSAAIFDG